MPAPASATKRKPALQQTKLTAINQQPTPRPSPTPTPSKPPTKKARQSNIADFLKPRNVSNEDKENVTEEYISNKRRKTSSQTPLRLSSIPSTTINQIKKPFQAADIDNDDEVFCLGSQQPSDFKARKEVATKGTATTKPEWVPVLGLAPTRSRKATPAPSNPKISAKLTSFEPTVIYIDEENASPQLEEGAGKREHARAEETTPLKGVEKRAEKRVVESSQWYENVDSQSAATQAPARFGWGIFSDSNSPGDIDGSKDSATCDAGAVALASSHSEAPPLIPPAGEFTILSLPGSQNSKQDSGVSRQHNSAASSANGATALQSKRGVLDEDTAVGVKVEAKNDREAPVLAVKQEQASTTPIKEESFDLLDFEDDDDLLAFEARLSPVSPTVDQLKKEPSPAAAEPSIFYSMKREPSPSPAPPQTTQLKHTRFRDTPIQHSAPRYPTADAASYDTRKRSPTPPQTRPKVIYSSDGDDDDEEFDYHEESIPETQLPKLPPSSQKANDGEDGDEDETPYFTFRPNAFERCYKQAIELPPAIRKPVTPHDFSIPYTQEDDAWNTRNSDLMEEDVVGCTQDVESVQNTQFPTPDRKSSFEENSVTLSQLLPKSLMEPFPLPSSIPPSSGQMLEETQ